ACTTSPSPDKPAVRTTASPIPEATRRSFAGQPLAGITLSAAWWMQLRSYRDLNTAKFQVINKLEEHLPARIFADEWEALKRDPIPGWRKRYAELGTSERIVPLVFVGAHLILFVGTLTI
ncbi:RipA family octameric membrane protein, partial [Streptomyces albidoflavus]